MRLDFDSLSVSEACAAASVQQRERWSAQYYRLIAWFAWMSVVLGFAAVVLLADLVQEIRQIRRARL